MNCRKKIIVNALNALLVMILVGCSSQPKQVEEPAVKAFDPAEADGIFVVPGIDFSQYKKLIVTDLELDEIDIRQPPPTSKNQSPWRLGEREKRFMREEYTQAVVMNLIADGAYATALDAGDDVLLLRSEITRIAPLVTSASAAAAKTMESYNASNGAMTISMELYDSISRKLVGTIISTRDLGRIWDENSSASVSLQVDLAFKYWLKGLRAQLDQLSRRQSPLDKLLIN